MRQTSAPSDISIPPVPDRLWEKIERDIIHSQIPRGLGRPIALDHRRLLDAIVYKLVTGCAWYRIPAGYPDGSQVARRYYAWRAEGLIEKIIMTLAADAEYGAALLHRADHAARPPQTAHAATTAPYGPADDGAAYDNHQRRMLATAAM